MSKTLSLQVRRVRSVVRTSVSTGSRRATQGGNATYGDTNSLIRVVNTNPEAMAPVAPPAGTGN